MSIRRGEDGDGYIRQYPRFAHWIVTCIACGRRGHRPDMPPNDDPDFHGENLRQYFQPLELDGTGLCDQCLHAAEGATELAADERATQ
jgi:hypothetical protein